MRATVGAVNTCSELDWVRSLAAHLWYLTHPLSSIPDAIHEYELAWRGTGPSGHYAKGPGPKYAESPVLGQARALVSCVPSPYDRDVLGFQVECTVRKLWEPGRSLFRELK